MNILICYGTRPEFIKINPLLKEFKKQGVAFKTLCVKQHTSLITDIQLADWTVDVPPSENRLDGLLGVPTVIPREVFENITHVITQGDTATALACSFAAFHRNIPVIHLEAGLRTYDSQNPYPEETYRQIISRIASIHLCPTSDNAANLKHEGITSNVFVVGNTVLDNLLEIRDKVSISNEILITLHRRENHPKIKQWFEVLNSLAISHPEYVFTLPIHPNPNVQKYRDLLSHVNIIEPLPYDQFIDRICSSLMIISDSGGIQEEASFFGKKVIVCRTTTERKEALNVSSFLCLKPEELSSIFENNIKNLIIEPSNVFGDGFASRKITEILMSKK